MKKFKVVIIGAGTAGLSARREVQKVTDNYVVIDDGPLGTTCARVGCMPSKVLIQVANDFHRRNSLIEEGIHGGEYLSVDHKEVMNHVRKLRDRFVNGVKQGLESWQNTHLIRKRAKLLDANTIDLGDEQIQADAIVIATGSSPILPKPWEEYKDFMISTDHFFELKDLPHSVAVIGLGVIGTEIGQAMARLGVKTVGIGSGKSFGGLSDPDLQNYAEKTLLEDMPISTAGADSFEVKGDQLEIISGSNTYLVEKVILSVGRKPNLLNLGLENLNIELDKRGMPLFDNSTMQIAGTKIFIAGDVNGERPILHEAADEGRIAGYNSTREEMQCFKRRENLGITFSDPNIAVIGKSFDTLKSERINFATGKVSFEGQGRSIVKLKEKGLLHIYGDKKSGKLLGAELIAPEGEHLAHLISWVISLGLSVHETLTLPFYHPVIEEGLRTALRDLAEHLDTETPALEVLRCQDPPVGF